jgi:putative transposase
LAIEVDGRIRSTHVIAVLSRLVSERGAPFYLRSDNGPEFVSRALLKWITDQGIAAALIDPGKPWQNGAGESFNGKFRGSERLSQAIRRLSHRESADFARRKRRERQALTWCLSLEWFRSRAEAKAVIETWRRHYNEMRPHSSLGYLTPAAFAARLREPEAATCQATGRTAAVCGASALHPVASPSRKGQTKAETGVVVSS